MHDFLLRHWHDILHFGDAHGVNPWVFGTLYLIHHPLFWGTMAWLAVCVRRKRPVAVLVILGVVFWTMPYAYILLFGRGLPWWAYAVALVFLAVGGLHVVKEIQKRLHGGGGGP